MTTYIISGRDGIVYGVYTADTADEAYRMLCAEAGAEIGDHTGFLYRTAEDCIAEAEGLDLADLDWRP